MGRKPYFSWSLLKDPAFVTPAPQNRFARRFAPPKVGGPGNWRALRVGTAQQLAGRQLTCVAIRGGGPRRLFQIGGVGLRGRRRRAGFGLTGQLEFAGARQVADFGLVVEFVVLFG